MSSFALLLALGASRSAPAPVVVTDQGSIQGTTDGTYPGVEQFLGIPYASVPRRFEPAVANTAPYATQPLNATAFGPSCVQGTVMNDQQSRGGGNALARTFGVPASDAAEAVDPPALPQFSEDCLSLNVWRAAEENEEEPAAKRAVMVWMHGGAFELGGSSLPYYHGAEFVSAQRDVLVVSMNYRLGPLGFLQTAPSGTGSLNGLRDVVEALKWVQRHIAAFGGDPARVTLFGESAGSLGTCVLCASPLAKGLFRRAILQSGACSGKNWGVLPQSVGTERLASFLRAHNASSVAELAERPGLAAAQALATWPALPGADLMAVHQLTLDDGVVLGELPAVAFARGAINPEAMVIGGNSFDGIAPWRRPLLPNTTAQLTQDLRLRWGVAAGAPVDADAVVKAYDPASHFGGDVSAAFVQLDGDETVVCPAQRLAAAAAVHLAPGAVYGYHFAHTYGYDVSFLYGLLTPHAPCVPWNCTWASHFAEVGFVFGNVALEPVPLPFTAGEAALHAEMMERWASFARTGVPSGDGARGAAVWQPVGRSGDAAQVALLSLTANSSNTTSAMLDASFKNAQCALLNWGDAPV